MPSRTPRRGPSRRRPGRSSKGCARTSTRSPASSGRRPMPATAPTPRWRSAGRAGLLGGQGSPCHGGRAGTAPARPRAAEPATGRHPGRLGQTEGRARGPPPRHLYPGPGLGPPVAPGRRGRQPDLARPRLLPLFSGEPRGAHPRPARGSFPPARGRSRHHGRTAEARRPPVPSARSAPANWKSSGPNSRNWSPKRIRNTRTRRSAWPP